MNSRIEKPWGWEEILEQNDKYVVKLLHVNAGQRLSLQLHKNKTETLFLYRGVGHITKFDKGGSQYNFMAHFLQKVHIPKGWTHRIEASRMEDVEFLEVSTPELDDVVRIEDDYGRTE